jgi:hypothetical protein
MFDDRSKLGPRNQPGARMPTTVDEMRHIVRCAAEPAAPGESVKAAIGRAARRLALDWGRARSLWYGDARVRVSADEADRLRRLHQARQSARLAELRADLALLEQEQASTAARLERLR